MKNKKNVKLRIIVIGGLSAGPSAAAKARRENEYAEILMFEKTANVSYATCGIPYALSGIIKDRESLLVVKADMLRNRFNIKLHLEEEVLDILPKEHKIITYKGEYNYDKLIFTTGARAIVPDIKNLFRAQNWSACRTLNDFDKIMEHGINENALHITVMGSGLIGVEVAENLIKIGKKVTLIEGESRVLGMWSNKFSFLAQKALEEKGIKVITGSYVNEFITEGNKIVGIPTENGILPCDFVIMSVGIRPNTEMLVKRGAEVIGNGALKVNHLMETSLPDIYAAGDNASIKNILTGHYDYFPLGTHSNKGGRAAGANAAGGMVHFDGAYGTAIIKLFNYTLAKTGITSTVLNKNNISYKTSLIIAGSTPGYYPNKKEMIIELFYEENSGVILGAQIFGEVNVDKRIDVLSTAVFAKLKITDLPKLDLAYAPPFAPAKDPVIVSGFVGSNAFVGAYEEIEVEEVARIMDLENKEDYTILDVRNFKEIRKQGQLPGAINIPLIDLREQLQKLNKNRNIIIYCQQGMRGYLAFLILHQNGFQKIQNMAGGFSFWKQMEQNF
jgi:NADPH-dependent 2,4-dienoyl-CoA reductase/sulfur reductase-like enzyme/rhodanese-related sulfurtransferase